MEGIELIDQDILFQDDSVDDFISTIDTSVFEDSSMPNHVTEDELYEPQETSIFEKINLPNHESDKELNLLKKPQKTSVFEDINLTNLDTDGELYEPPRKKISDKKLTSKGEIRIQQLRQIGKQTEFRNIWRRRARREFRYQFHLPNLIFILEIL